MPLCRRATTDAGPHWPGTLTWSTPGAGSRSGFVGCRVGAACSAYSTFVGGVFFVATSHLIHLRGQLAEVPGHDPGIRLLCMASLGLLEGQMPPSGRRPPYLAQLNDPAKYALQLIRESADGEAERVEPLGEVHDLVLSSSKRRPLGAGLPTLRAAPARSPYRHVRAQHEAGGTYEMRPEPRPEAPKTRDDQSSAEASQTAKTPVRAEVAGFEPARGDKPSTRLAGGRHKPD